MREASALLLVTISAWEGLVDHAAIQTRTAVYASQTVLIHAAVQIALA
jgi:hypothetical protein